MKYDYLTHKIELPNLAEKDIINIQEYLEKLQFFQKYSQYSGTYIVDQRYVKYSEIGLHYYNWQTLIDYFNTLQKEHPKSSHVEITFDPMTWKLFGKVLVN